MAGLSAATALSVLLLAVGSTIAAFIFKQETQRTREALWHAYRSEAQMRSRSGQVGQRILTLETLAKAAAIRPSPELRTTAIQAMALPDLRELSGIVCPTGALVRFDDQVANYAQFDRFGSNNFLSIFHTTNGREEARLPLTRRNIMFHFSPQGRFVTVEFPQPIAAAT